MARNLDTIIDNTLLRLGMPRAQAPTREMVLQQALTQIRTLLRAKQNVSNQWNFGETVVEITPDEDTYLISDDSFGTPLVVTTVPQNSNDVIRIVPFYCPQNLNFSYGWPVNAGSYAYANWNGTSNANALRCAIFWQNNLPYIRFNPVPALSPAAYTIAFLQSANNVNTVALTATPLMDQDIDLVEVRAAKGLLANVEWDGSDNKRNSEKRKDLLVTLSSDEQLLAQQFDIGNRITTGPHLSVRWNTCVE